MIYFENLQFYLIRYSRLGSLTVALVVKMAYKPCCLNNKSRMMSNSYVTCCNITLSIFTRSHITSYSGSFERISLKFFSANFSVSYE